MPEEMYAKSPPSGDRDDRRRGVVRPDERDGHAATEGRQERAESGLPGRGVRAAGRPGGPWRRDQGRSHPRVVASSNPVVRRVRALGGLDAGQPVAEEVGTRSPVRQHGVGVGGELEDGVERQVLETVAPVQLVGGHAGVDGVDAVLVPSVPVVGGQAEQASLAEESVVHRPRVDADARQVGVLGAGPAESGHDLPVQLDDVPVQGVAGRARAGRPGRSGSGRRGPSDAVPVHVADDDPPARRAEVDRGDAAAVRHGVPYRRNAAATPASTGTCSPVVCEKSDVQMAYTAFATFSGTTSRLRMVRWA